MITNFRLYENFNIKSDEDKTNVAVKVLHILSQFQIFHWQTPKMSSHKTFDDFTEDFKEIGDKLIEVIQGKYGRIELVDDIYLPIRNIQEIEPYQFTDNCIEFFTVCKTNVFTNDDEIISIIDEIIANLQQLKYLLSFDEKTYNESVEEIYIQNGHISYDDTFYEIYPFLSDKSGNDIHIGKIHSVHSSIEYDKGINRNDYPVQGRIWIEHKIIGFWQDEGPDIYHLDSSFFQKLQIALEDDGVVVGDIMNYKVSIDIGYIKMNDSDLYWYQLPEDKIKIIEENGYDFINGNLHIPVKDYINMNIEKYINIEIEEIKKQKLLHLMNAKEKEAYYKKHGKAKGFGSDKTSFTSKNPIDWRQAKMRSEKANDKRIKKWIKFY